MRKTWIASLCVLLAGATFASAAPVYGTDATSELISSRDQSHFVTGGNYSSRDFGVDWEVEFVGGVIWSYTYNFTGLGQPEVSHFILDLTDDAVFPYDKNAVTGATGPIQKLTFGLFDPSQPGNSNPGLGGPIIGVKFDLKNPGENFSVSFLSNRAPVYGDIYFKGASSSFAYNNGLTLHGTSMNINDFIVRPNGIVPEPSSFALMGLGLGVAGLVAHRRRRKAMKA